MSFGGDMSPNMGTTINKIACATNGRKLNNASHTLFKCAYRRYRPYRRKKKKNVMHDMCHGSMVVGKRDGDGDVEGEEEEDIGRKTAPSNREPTVHKVEFVGGVLQVCVSLLGTWSGKGTEVWTSQSNLLQVIISIQGLILVSEPYFNEAGYERQKGTQQGRENSRMYNEMVVLKLIQAMAKTSSKIGMLAGNFRKLQHHPPSVTNNSHHIPGDS
ncbi:(E3-independent) E2 ubiquitin-conjugating enzyme [Portunus trituberculatus]|uniref:(E3-independent) E2 ubiquitin-conjugating enzyme n=1 Tax=Portunus trituberculatus TaxID=210409 RepID=A0A5B7D1F7_PORTR|nr:(E3-independent) E2 ubiquitin-conjugating enzyme [Portunus trituberculatus]